MRVIIIPLHTTITTLMKTLDVDVEVLNEYLTVQKMAETNDEEKRLLVLEEEELKNLIKLCRIIFYFSKKITENRCLKQCLDVSLDIAQQINSLWEPLQRLAPIFNINTKVDFLVK